MNDQTDLQLLRAYAEDHAEPAFAELVRRHVDFVHSAALRMVCDSHLAHDVAQGVFVALAKNAAQLLDRPVLSGWLHRTAQNIAAQTVRTDVRRRVREQEAAAMNELLSDQPEAVWKQIAPHLDAALGELSEPDRDALLLRYFERKSAQEMAQTLGISDEAAQKRVSRAVERLREFFSKRNVTIGASGLAVVISANAVQAAPIGLAATISAAVFTGTAVATSTAIATTKIIAMTTIQKALVTVTVVALAGAGIYEARQAAQLREKNQTLQQQQAPLAEQIQQLRRERDDAVNRWTSMTDESATRNGNNLELLKLREEVTRLRQSSAKVVENDSRAALVKSWLAREDQLKQFVQQYPGKTIPEFQLLSEQQWLDAAMNAKFDTDKDVQKELANLRHAAENNFVSQAHDALSKYMKANDGQFPTDLSQLQSYFSSPMDEAVLQRWEIAPASANPSVGVGDMIITEKAAVDESLDQRWAIGARGYGSGNWESRDIGAALAIIKPVMKAYAAANNGGEPSDPSQVLPYLTTPEQKAAYQTLMKRFPTNNASH